LFPVARAGPRQSRHHFAVSLTASLLFSSVCAVFVLVYSREILAIFNPAYPDIAGTSLRFLGFSLIGSTLKFHACTLARLADAMRRASVWFALGGVLELAFVVVGARLGGLEGLVVGWTVAVSIEGACMVIYRLYAVGSADPAGPTRQLPAAPTGQTGAVQDRRRRPDGSDPAPPAARAPRGRAGGNLFMATGGIDR